MRDRPAPQEPAFASDRSDAIYNYICADSLCVVPSIVRGRGRPFDAIITDPPYSERTHGGQVPSISHAIDYDHLSPRAIPRIVEMMVGACHGWIVICTDHVLWPIWEAELARHGWMTFAPIPAVTVGRAVRFTGDGPSSWTDFLVVARARRAALVGGWTTPGAYVQPAERNSDRKRAIGGKPLALASSLVHDYSRVGWSILDPFAGAGTFGLAAIAQRRRWTGIELRSSIVRDASPRLEEWARQERLLWGMTAPDDGLPLDDRKPKRKRGSATADQTAGTDAGSASEAAAGPAADHPRRAPRKRRIHPGKAPRPAQAE